jgi:hypothetical protein
MKLISLITLLISLSTFNNCRKEEKKNNNGSLLLLLALASRSSSASTQENAEAYANNASITSEDSAESGSGVQGSSSKAFTYSGDSLGGTMTITDEIYDCWLGGTITFNGSSTFSATSTDFYNRTTTLSNSNRTISYNGCKVSNFVTINSGAITFTQVSSDSGSTTMETKVISGTTSSGTLQRTLTNWKGTVKGSMTIAVTGRRGSGTYTIQHDHTLVLPSRVRTWTLVNGKVRSPQLVSRTGTLTGSTTVNGTKYTINKSLDVNID